MTQIVLAIVSLLLAANFANALITPEEAKNLALRQFDLTSVKQSYDSEIDEQSLVEFMKTYDNSAGHGHVNRVLSKVHQIVESFQETKKHHEKFRLLANALRDIEEYLAVDELEADSQQIYKVVNNERQANVDILNVLAHNKDAETKCVTNASSVDLIMKLYHSVAYAQTETLTVQLYNHNLQERLNKDSHKDETDKLIAKFNEKMTSTFNNFNKAIETATEEIKKCEN